MPSPLSIFLSRLKLSFHSQWNEQAKESIAHIVQTKSIAIPSALFVASLILQIVTGILLSMHFSPSSSQLVNDQGILLKAERNSTVKLDPEGDTLAMPGEMLFLSANPQDIIPTQSYFSIVQIDQTRPLNYIRGIHVVNTHALIALMIYLLVFLGFKVKDTRFFKGLWSLLITIGFLIASIAWLGYILPWDQFASTSYLIFQGMMEQGLGLNIGQSADIIARYFSLHSILLPVILILMLSLINRFFRINFKNIHQAIFYGFMIFMMIAGVIAQSFITLLPPAHAVLPSSLSHEPAWFFQSLHGVVSSMPADLALFLITIALIVLYTLPFMNSYRMRMSALGIILLASTIFAIFY